MIGRNRSFRRRLVMLSVVLIVAIAYFFLRTPALGTREHLNILIVGIEGVVTFETTPSAPVESAPTAHSVALLSLHPKRRSAHLLLIPNDVLVPPDASDPLAAYDASQPLLYLVDGHGAESITLFLEDTLDVPVHHVVRIDSLSFMQLVDRVDGLAIDAEGVLTEAVASYVPGREPKTGAEIHRLLQESALESGPDRIEMQAAVYVAALGSIRRQKRLVHLEDLFQFARRHLETDLEAERLFAVAKHLYTIPADRIRLEVLPGRFIETGYEINADTLALLVERTYN